MVDFSELVALPSTVTGSSAFLKFVPLPLLSPTMIVYHSTMGHRLHYINVFNIVDHLAPRSIECAVLLQCWLGI